MTSRLRLLLVGSGGREHALAWKLAQSPRLEKLFCAPGNAGMAQVATCVPISSGDLTGLADFAAQERIELTIVGPEAPLAAGIVDLFQARGLRVFGPTRSAALLESSKVWSKDFFSRHGLPTANFGTFDVPEDAIAYLETQEFPLAVKADGLAAGKGVTIAHTREEAIEAIQESLVRGAFGEAGRRVVIEEFLEGPELSVMAISDGAHLYVLPPSQDHKQVFDGDQGPNTGGMGAYSPVSFFTEDLFEEVVEGIMRPTVQHLAQEGRPFVGCLYAGLVLTQEGPKLLEYNGRFGDPETQVVLPRLKDDLVEVLEAAVDGNLPDTTAETASGAAACVVLASGGYPRAYETGKIIDGLEAAAGVPGVVVFQAGTKATDEGPVTAGGRVLGVTGLADTLPQAIDTAYRGVREIRFENLHYRTDIGRRGEKTQS